VTFESLLKQERKRLKLTQASVANIANIERETWARYESGKLKPGTDVLLAFANAGADVQYILTGVRSSTVLAPDEQLLLERYRTASQSGKDAILGAALGQGSGSGIGQQFNAPIHQMAGRDIRNKKD
jgi:transcriptional regulator with XRE-family HTH domain